MNIDLNIIERTIRISSPVVLHANLIGIINKVVIRENIKNNLDGLKVKS